MQKHKQKTVQKTVKDSLYELFRSHIGLENGLTQKEILQKLYGKNDSFLESYYNWRHKVLSTMSYLRKNTRMFIVSGQLFGKTVYFVMKASEEQMAFENRCNKDIDGFNRTIKRSKKALQEKWWKNL